jgi:hypothetical protein
VKDCVIDYAKDTMMENMLSQVIKDNEIEALISLLHENAIPKIIAVYLSTRDNPAADRPNTIRRIITFFLECVWVLRIHHADNTKTVFLNSFYSSGMLRIAGELLADGWHKVLEVLGCLGALDGPMFFSEFMNDYRSSSEHNLVRIIGRKFS